MKISPEEVRKAALLSRLQLSAEEEEKLTFQLDKILQYIDKLNELDTSNIDPLAHIVDVKAHLRPDRVTNHPASDLLLSNAPSRENQFFRVPKIIE